jgi:ribonuclease P protein component
LLKQSLTLGKAQRLRKPADYRRVYQSKQWGGSTYYSFNVYPLVPFGERAKCLDYQQQANSLIGVTVSKKVSKSAVVRNRIKRQIKEFYRLHQDELYDAELVITAKPACAKAPDAERQQSLLELWSKVQKWQRWRRRTDASAET